MIELLRWAGCDASNANYHTTLRRMNTHLSKKMDGSIDLLAPRPFDGEYYRMGALAAFILRFSENQTWYTDISEKKKHILDVLFTGVKETRDTKLHPEIAGKFKSSESKYNQLLNPFLGSTDAQLADQAYVRVPVALRSFNPFFFGYLRSQRKTQVLVTEGENTVNVNGVPFTSADKTVLVAENEGSSTPCRTGDEPAGHFVLVRKTEIIEKQGNIALHSPALSGEVRGQLKTGADGFSYLCE